MRDAPYIEKAEQEGMPHPAVMECPVCHRKAQYDLIVLASDHSEIVGCTNCLRRVSVDEYLERRGEA